MLTDSFGRRIDYLRVSVTDRCNLRCSYCLPESFSRFSPPSELLEDDELAELAACFAELGVTSLRLTGGEPLLRRGLAGLVARLARLPGVRDLSLSTNGVLLGRLAAPLAQAGLGRVNVSLDSLDPGTFARLTRFGKLQDVLDGLAAARAAGLSPVKLNVVVVRGVNDGELARFADLTLESALHVRFIELMPMGETGFFTRDRWLPLAQMRERAGPLEPAPDGECPFGRGPASYWRRPGARGTVGFIAAVSCGFCSSCNRMRLTAKGVLVPCLDGEEGVDLRAALRGGGRAAVREAILRATAVKPEAHAMLARAEAGSAGPRLMCQVGG